MRNSVSDLGFVVLLEEGIKSGTNILDAILILRRMNLCRLPLRAFDGTVRCHSYGLPVASEPS